MDQPIARRVALRAAQFAMAAAGILFLLLLFSRQAHAADGPPSALGDVTSTVSAVTGSAPSASTVTSAAAAPVSNVVGSVIGQRQVSPAATVSLVAQ